MLHLGHIDPDPLTVCLVKLNAECLISAVKWSLVMRFSSVGLGFAVSLAMGVSAVQSADLYGSV